MSTIINFLFILSIFKEARVEASFLFLLWFSLFGFVKFAFGFLGFFFRAFEKITLGFFIFQLSERLNKRTGSISVLRVIIFYTVFAKVRARASISSQRSVVTADFRVGTLSMNTVFFSGSSIAFICFAETAAQLPLSINATVLP